MICQYLNVWVWSKIENHYLQLTRVKYFRCQCIGLRRRAGPASPRRVWRTTPHRCPSPRHCTRPRCPVAGPREPPTARRQWAVVARIRRLPPTTPAVWAAYIPASSTTPVGRGSWVTSRPWGATGPTSSTIVTGQYLLYRSVVSLWLTLSISHTFYKDKNNCTSSFFHSEFLFCTFLLGLWIWSENNCFGVTGLDLRGCTLTTSTPRRHRARPRPTVSAQNYTNMYCRSTFSWQAGPPAGALYWCRFFNKPLRVGSPYNVASALISTKCTDVKV